MTNLAFSSSLRSASLSIFCLLTACGSDASESADAGQVSTSTDGKGSTGTRKDAGASGSGTTGAAHDAPTHVEDSGTRAIRMDASAVGGKGTPASGSTGIPCDVQAVLTTACGTCHGAEPAFGAPMSLATAADFQATALDKQSKVYDVAKARIDDTDPRKRMPPAIAPALTPEQRTLLDTWLAGRAQPTSERCAPPVSVDAGTPDASVQSVGDLECYRMLAHDGTDLKAPYKVGLAKDAYFNFVFAAPWKGTAYGVVIRPVIDNKTVIHHWLLFQDGTKGTPAPGVKASGTHPGGQLLHGWAPGAEEIDFRTTGADVGLELPDTTYTVEVHYNSKDEAALDASGVEICVAKQKPANVAALSWLGYDQLLTPAAKWTGTCKPISKEPIHIVSVWPHMHLTGTHMKGTIKRADGTSEVLHDEAFDFNYQRLYKKNVTLMPGDSVVTDCTYSQPMRFGEGTDQEMCYLFTMAYPKGALSDMGSWGQQAHGDGACLGE